MKIYLYIEIYKKQDPFVYKNIQIDLNKKKLYIYIEIYRLITKANIKFVMERNYTNYNYDKHIRFLYLLFMEIALN